MAANSSSAINAGSDPCGSFGATQFWAMVWFFSVVAIGAGLAYTLCNTDYYNYATNGEFFDYAAYRDNRSSQTHIPTLADDRRMHGDLGTALERLNEK